MSLKSLIGTGTKVWLDGVDPADVQKNFNWGITGATSNPTIISGILGKGGFDQRINDLISQGLDDEAIAWALDDDLVQAAQKVFLPVWDKTRGDDGYVSFELDPFIEDESLALPHRERVRRYGELGRRWAAGHKNRMIKVPATPAGLDALEDLAAAGLTLNVTLMFTERQYQLASEAIWRGAQRRPKGLNDFKSVYSIFISRIDVYTDQRFRNLSPEAQGQVGLATAKRVWRRNQEFWREKSLRLKQEIVFASTGVKKQSEAPDMYVEALAGSDIETNPPSTNDAVEHLGKTYTRQIERMPPSTVLDEIDRKLDMLELERTLISEGVRKFVEPQEALLNLIATKRASAAKPLAQKGR
jgi:transaldolase